MTDPLAHVCTPLCGTPAPNDPGRVLHVEYIRIDPDVRTNLELPARGVTDARAIPEHRPKDKRWRVEFTTPGL